MATTNPNPVTANATLPDGRYVAFSERTIGDGAAARPAKIGKAYLEKKTARRGAQPSLSYVNSKGEPIGHTAEQWAKKYNKEFFNIVDRPAVSPGPEVQPGGPGTTTLTWVDHNTGERGTLSYTSVRN